MRALIKLRLHGYDFKIRMSGKYLAVYYVQKNTVYMTRQILRPRSLIDTLTNRDQQNSVTAQQPQQEIPYRELLKDIADKYRTVSKEELQEMTREYCSRINAYRTKLIQVSEKSIIDKSQPFNNLKKDIQRTSRKRSNHVPKESTKDMVQKLIDRNEMHSKRLQMLENGDQGMDKTSMEQIYRERMKKYFKRVRTLENGSPLKESKFDEVQDSIPKESNRVKKRDLKMDKEDIMQEYRKRNEEFMKQLQTLERTLPREVEENVKLQTSSPEEKKTGKKVEVEMDRDIIQKYRKQNEEYMKQLQTLEKTLPPEVEENFKVQTSAPKEKKAGKKLEVEMDRDIIQEYRKRNEEYMKQLETLERTLPQEVGENVKVQTSAPEEKKTGKKLEVEMDRDIIQKYRKRNEEYMKQLQTLESTGPEEDKENVKLQTSVPEEKKTRKKLEEEMDLQQRMDIIQEYRKRNEEYMRQLQTLEETLPQKDEENVKVQTSDRKERKTARIEEVESNKTTGTKKKEAEMDNLEEILAKPKRPFTAYMLFVKDRVANDPSCRGKGALKKIGEVWKTLEEEQKQVYEAKAIDLKAYYERELLIWEMEMIEKKHFIAVRRATLKKIGTIP